MAMRLDFVLLQTAPMRNAWFGRQYASIQTPGPSRLDL
jgi:hypothetical protein